MKTYKYQLHTHTTPCSLCAGMTPKELIRGLLEGGYQGCVLTNHFMHGNTGIDRDLPWEERVELFCKGYENAKAMGDEGADDLLAFVYKKGNSEADGTDPRKAFEFNLKRAEEGDPEAQYQVYQAYEKGAGVEENEDLAWEWCKKAADNGHNIAQALMGFHYLINDNNPMAVVYWEKASQQPDST